jgi:squalene-hopene/tetraprenyl-beta-curcumene cyclase
MSKVSRLLAHRRALIQIPVVVFLNVAFATENLELSLQRELEHSVKIGLNWLMTQQEANGSWNNHPAITGLTVTALLRSHRSVTDDLPVVNKAIQYILSCVKPDGSIYTDDMPCYNTSICIMALKTTENPAYNGIIANASRFLMKSQLDEDEGYTSDSLYFGGMGYSGEDRPDLSNLQWALEAIWQQEKMSDMANPSPPDKEGLSQRKAYFDRAIIFLQRCQNLQKYNDRPYSANDGGFMYGPGQSKAGGVTSYGSMTYAGLKSFVYAKLEPGDPRVKAAYDWVRGHYTVEENPNLGKMGLFYYYLTMAKALNAIGHSEIEDISHVKHSWRYDIVNKLISIQNEEGWWQNEVGRWWENNRILVTAYSILALEEAGNIQASGKRTLIIEKE